MATALDRDGVRTYELVLHHIESGILDGTYRKGDQLPPERDLASQLNVGRSAVREAMRVLQTQGLITTSTGRGGGTRLTPTQGDALARIFRLHLALAGSGVADLTETRVALERASAAMAARRATAQTLTQLTTLVDVMETADTVDAFSDLDTEFHVLIARAGRNDLVADLTVAIRQTVRGPIRAASLEMPDWPGFRLRLVSDHARILGAIVAGQPEEAAELMEAHIRAAYAVLTPD